MATGGSGVHIWNVPGNAAEEFPSLTGNVTIQCKFELLVASFVISLNGCHAIAFCFVCHWLLGRKQK